MSTNTKVILLCSMLSVCACQSSNYSTPAPVVAYAVKLSDVPEIYKVREGDSLYTIAWKYDLDFEKIAKQNNLDLDENIYPGQKIYLKGKNPNIKVIAGVNPPKARIKRAAKPVAASVSAINTHQPSTEIVPSKTVSQSVQKVIKRVASAEKWQLPARGSVVKKYSEGKNDFNKGIDIAGQLNDKVIASKSGKVVYSGSGLRGYGKLIIIKHDDSFLSAYAHNNELLVKEGDDVQQGQQIAKMGQTDSNRIKLHFQIRKNGQPVNPSSYLGS